VSFDTKRQGACGVAKVAQLFSFEVDRQEDWNRVIIDRGCVPA
jgi:hypothetical protein